VGHAVSIEEPDHDHDHAHGDHRADAHGPGEVDTRRLALAAAVNGGFGVAQVVGGLVIGSVAVLADALHQAADAAGLLIALLAAVLARRPPSKRRSFGWGRADALGAQLSASLLLGSLVWLAWESIERLRHPVDVSAGGVSAFGAAGLAVNAIGLVLLRDAHAGHGHATDAGHHHRLSLRAARLHLLTDLGGSAVVLLAGIGVAATGVDRLDPIASLVISVAAAAATVGLLRQATGVLLDRVPAHLDMDEVLTALTGEPGVDEVHHLHLWSMGSSGVALSAHVRLAGDLALHDAQERTREFEDLLADRFGIHHTTLQIECHDCEAPSH
jgi:cobalt-zinc-cadmium efflux system protein